MPTLILPPRYTPDSIAVRGAAVEAGWHVERLASWRVSPDKSFHQPALYGESLFGAVIAEQLSLTLYEPPFAWLAELPFEYVSRDIRFCDLAEARRTPHTAFIKPADDKCFPAKVYPDGESLPSSEILPDRTPVLVSEPVEWNIEFRFFVLNGEIKTCSPYSRNNRLIQDERGAWLASEAETKQAVAFCRRVLADVAVTLPPSVVIDCGEIIGRGWAVVEANPSWASGIYGCDPHQVLAVIAEACMLQSQITSDTRRWVIERTEQPLSL